MTNKRSKIPNDFYSLFIEPFLFMESLDREERNEIFKKLLEKIISSDKTNYFKILEKHLDWLSSFESNKILSKYLINLLQKDHFFYNCFNKILVIICEEAIKSDFFKDPYRIRAINDIIIEHVILGIDIYHIKLLSHNESLNKLEQQIVDIVDKNLGFEPICSHFLNNLYLDPHGYKFPKNRGECRFEISDKFALSIFFIRNDITIFPFNNVYFIIWPFKKDVKLWEDLSGEAKQKVKKIINDILLLPSIEIINTYNLPKEIESAIDIISIKNTHQMQLYIKKKLDDYSFNTVLLDFEETLKIFKQGGTRSPVNQLRVVYEGVVEELVKTLGGTKSNMKDNLKFLETKKILKETTGNRGDQNLEATYSYNLYSLLPFYGSHPNPLSLEFLTSLFFQVISWMFLILKRYESII
ncbi:hypothetical protein ES706_05786 [subsurface metagenome]